MNSVLFEQLLHKEESATLDFKQKQYPFAKANEREKSELLKDILGFANAWRPSEAYILIGVKEIRGGKRNVVGIPDHLPDNALQEFVNSLTNQPVRFNYEAFGFEDKKVGIICIEDQSNPIYLKRDYGKLLKEKVYVRRGSSTSPTKPASIEEIFQMGVDSVQRSADVLVEFADVEGDDVLGTNISLDVELCKMPEMETIPDLSSRQRRQPLDLGMMPSMMQSDPFNRQNRDFLRELANYEFVRRLFRPVRLTVKNVGQVVTNNVQVELTIPMNVGAAVTNLLDRPQKTTSIASNVGYEAIQSALRRGLGEVHIDKNDERYRVEIDCGDLQPGRRVRSDVFYIGKGQSGDLSLGGVVFADNLAPPKDFTLTVSATITQTEMSVGDLRSLSDAWDQLE